MCAGFEKRINSLHASEKYDIYITGSNAFLLSSDLATLFTGRTFESDVFNTLIVRDIQRKYQIRNISLMERLCDFLIENISNLISTRGVAATFTREQVKTNDRTISAYIKYLCNTFAFYKVRRYDIQGKRYLASNDKYYLSDHSFKYAKLGTKNADYGRMIENIVASELQRRGYELYTGVLYKKEIDFVPSSVAKSYTFRYPAT